MRWYTVSCYMGQENKLKVLLERLAQELKISHRLKRVIIPIERVEVEKNERVVEKRKKLYPGMIVVEIDRLDHTLHSFLIGTPGVLGVSERELRESELHTLVGLSKGRERTTPELGVRIGSRVRIEKESFRGIEGEVVLINNGRLTIATEFLGRLVPIEMEVTDVLIL